MLVLYARTIYKASFAHGRVRIEVRARLDSAEHAGIVQQRWRGALRMSGDVERREVARVY